VRLLQYRMQPYLIINETWHWGPALEVAVLLVLAHLHLIRDPPPLSIPSTFLEKYGDLQVSDFSFALKSPYNFVYHKY
jgi:hypothetical protein